MSGRRTTTSRLLESAWPAQHVRRFALEPGALERERVLTGFCHDVRGPITAVATATTALRDGPLDAARIKSWLDRVELASARLQQQVDELFAFALIDAGRIVPRFAPHAAGGLLAEAAGACVKDASVRAVDVDVDADNVAAVRCDRALVLQALGNVIGHALASVERGATLALRVAARDDVDDAVFSVASVGAEPARSYPQTERAPSTWRARGLSLAIAEGIVRAHGGRTWVHDPSVRVALSFTLPRA